MSVAASTEYVLDPHFWVGQRWFPTSGKWHLLYADGRTVCGSSVEIHEDGPLDGVPAGELCRNCERVAIARRLEIDEDWA